MQSRLLACFVLVLVLALGCESSPPPAERAPERIERDPAHSVSDGAMRLAVHRVEQEGWSGRLVVVSFAPAGRVIRVVPSESPQPLSAIVAPLGLARPFAAIDGGFYDTDGEPMGVVRTEGRDVHPREDDGGSGVFIIDEGRPRIVHRDAYRGTRNVSDALQSIDRIVADGASVVTGNASPRRAARSAIAITQDFGVHLVVAFDERAVAHEEDALIRLGPQSAQTGPTLAQLAELLVRPTRDGGPVGAHDALGLDGGFSTSLDVKSAVRSLRVVAHRATISAIAVSMRAQ